MWFDDTSKALNIYFVFVLHLSYKSVDQRSYFSNFMLNQLEI